MNLQLYLGWDFVFYTVCLQLCCFGWGTIKTVLVCNFIFHPLAQFQFLLDILAPAIFEGNVHPMNKCRFCFTEKWDICACIYVCMCVCMHTRAYVWKDGKVLTCFPRVGSTWGNKEYTNPNASNPPTILHWIRGQRQCRRVEIPTVIVAMCRGSHKGGTESEDWRPACRLQKRLLGMLTRF